MFLLSGFSHLAREITDVGRLEPVLVTFLNEARKLSDVIARSGVEWVELHGFQPPSVVSELRAAFGAGLRIIKVLHVLGQRCLEGSLSKAYERAGASFILFDAATPDGRLGSSGQLLDSGLVCALADGLTVPFLIAGGISALSLEHHRPAMTHPRFSGIDIDTAARDERGKICGAKLAALSRSCEVFCGEVERHDVVLH